MKFWIHEAFYVFSVFITVINVTNAFNREGVTTYGHIMTDVKPHGVIVKNLNEAKVEIFYTEEFNADKNPLKVYFNYFFENSGQRDIVEIDNLCADYKHGSKENAAKLYVLTSFANTDKCPIKKGTKVIFTIGKPYKYSIDNRSCGITYGSIGLFKKNSKQETLSLAFLFHYRANVTGSDC